MRRVWLLIEFAIAGSLAAWGWSTVFAVIDQPAPVSYLAGFGIIAGFMFGFWALDALAELLEHTQKTRGS